MAMAIDARIVSEAFKRKLQEHVTFMAEKCWPENLEGFLKDLNRIIKAGVDLEAVEDVMVLPDDEVKAVATNLFPLRVLDMKREARQYLVDILIKQGVSADFLK